LVFFIQAEHLRIVPPEEIIPISPDVPEDYKHIVVSLPEQMMAAYEDDRVVFSARVSTGVGKGDSHYASTPTGGFHTFFKRPAGHMVGGDAGSAYDLPGVPWSSYINDSGVSFHGTYWHNDFGTPHSHGCINLPSDDAKWIYRWTTPVVPTGKRYIYKPGTGTTVYISDRPVFQMGWR
jgi:lipoprotein-anchoring transpeptidase ErfK/SrfK